MAVVENFSMVVLMMIFGHVLHKEDGLFKNSKLTT